RNLRTHRFPHSLRWFGRRYHDRQRRPVWSLLLTLHARREPRLPGHARLRSGNHLYQRSNDRSGGAPAVRWREGYRQWTSRRRRWRHRLLYGVEIGIRRLLRSFAEGADRSAGVGCILRFLMLVSDCCLVRIWLQLSALSYSGIGGRRIRQTTSKWFRAMSRWGRAPSPVRPSVARHFRFFSNEEQGG